MSSNKPSKHPAEKIGDVALALAGAAIAAVGTAVGAYVKKKMSGKNSPKK